MIRHNIQSEDLTLSYRVVGAGPRDVMLVHGWMVSGAVWDDLVAALDMEGLRLILPDLRGSGSSGRPQSGYTIEQYAADVLKVADAVGSSRFVIVGHSMGGPIAPWLSATSPDRISGSILLCPVPAQGQQLPDDVAALFRNCGQNRGMQKTILDAACKQLSSAACERLLDDAQGTSVECISQAFDAWTGGGFSDRLAAIVAPTLCVATDDPFLPPAYLRQQIVNLIRGARLAVLPGPGHYVQVEKPAETAALLEAFLCALPRE